MEPVLVSIAHALRDALRDVNEAQQWIERGKRGPYNEQTERTVQRLLASVEDNLTETVVGIRLIKTKDPERFSGNHHGD